MILPLCCYPSIPCSPCVWSGGIWAGSRSSCERWSLWWIWTCWGRPCTREWCLTRWGECRGSQRWPCSQPGGFASIQSPKIGWRACKNMCNGHLDKMYTRFDCKRDLFLNFITSYVSLELLHYLIACSQANYRKTRDYPGLLCQSLKFCEIYCIIQLWKMLLLKPKNFLLYLGS